MLDFLQRIERGEVLLADGAMGTQLMLHGLKIGECPEAYNLDRAEVLEQIARGYLQAGAQIIQSNTFGASSLKLAQYGLEGQTQQINAAAVAAVRRVVGEAGYVAASCGSTGKMLKPYGDTEPEVIFESFVEQMRAQVDAGADLISVETMIDLEEAKLAVAAARSVSRTIPVLASMTFDPTPRGFYTVMGVTIAQAADQLTQAGANLVGSNCGNGAETMVQVAREFRKQSRAKLVIQSNAGLPELQQGQAVYNESPEFMATHALQLVQMGVSVIGGCCGTTPEHIGALRHMLDKHGQAGVP